MQTAKKLELSTKTLCKRTSFKLTAKKHFVPPQAPFKTTIIVAICVMDTSVKQEMEAADHSKQFQNSVTANQNSSPWCRFVDIL